MNGKRYDDGQFRPKDILFQPAAADRNRIPAGV